MLAAVVPIGLLIGLVLGLVGSGGALLSTPLLLLTGHFSFQQASTSALFVVFSSSLVALLVRQRSGFPFRTVVQAILLGAIGTPAGVMLSNFISNQASRGLLGGLLLLAGYLTWTAHRREEEGASAVGNRWLSYSLFVFVGFMTGLTGIGGGYILVPVLHLVCGIKFKPAITASLYVVIVNATVSIALRGVNGFDLDSEQWVAASVLVAVAAIGSFAGAFLSNRLNRTLVQKIFALLLLTLAVALILQFFGFFSA